MGLSKKGKQQLSFGTVRSLESRKHRKVEYENQRKRDNLRKQREEEDYWDEYEDFSLVLSSEESDYNESSSEQPSSNEEENEVIAYTSKREGDIREGSGDDEGGVQLQTQERTFEPKWNSDAGGYLRGLRGCSSSATDTREKIRKKEWEKSASHTKSIVDMFSAQHKRNTLHHSVPLPTVSPSVIPSEIPTPQLVKTVETKFELRTQAVHDLGELLRLETRQMDKYGHELSHKSSCYRRHQMVRSFLWMQLNKEKDNPGCNRQALARIVAQSFNKRKYTGQKTVQWERSWMKLRVIPNTGAGNKKGDL